MKFYLVGKKKETMKLIGKWRELKTILLSLITETQKNFSLYSSMDLGMLALNP